MVYKATPDPDTMYLHQDIKQPDRKILKAIQKEMNDQMGNGKFSIVKRI